MSARQALLSLVNGEPLVAEPQQARASRQFVEDFELVAMHYRLHELGEYDDAKVAARDDIENAIVCCAELVASIRAETSWRSKWGGEAMFAEGLEQCQQDAHARGYFTGRVVAELPKPDAFPDDRRTCNQCVNLQGCVCSVAYPGGVVSSIRGYQPVRDVLHRCGGYMPIADVRNFSPPSRDGINFNHGKEKNELS